MSSCIAVLEWFFPVKNCLIHIEIFLVMLPFESPAKRTFEPLKPKMKFVTFFFWSKRQEPWLFI
jgi:hypothetical protein